MAPSILGSALSDSLWQAEQTPWGIGAQGVAGAIPGLYNPQASNSRNFWMTLGGGILGTVLAGLGRNQADERNAELYSGFASLRSAATQPERDAIVKQYPRLSQSAFALEAAEDQTARNIRENIATGIARNAGLENFGQGGGELSRGLTDFVLGRTTSLPTTGNALPTDQQQSPGQYAQLASTQQPNSVIPQEQNLIPPTPQEFYDRRFQDLVRKGNRPVQASATAREETDRQYGDTAKLREKVQEKLSVGRKSLEALQRMGNALPKMGSEGPLNESLISGRRIGAVFSDKMAEELDARAEFNAAASDLQIGQLQGLGVASDKDMGIAAEKVGKLSGGMTTREARAIYESIRPVQERAYDYSKEKQDWINTRQTDLNFDSLWARYSEDERIYNKDGKIRTPKSFQEWLSTKTGERAAAQVAKNPQAQGSTARRPATLQLEPLEKSMPTLQELQNEITRRGLR